MNKRLQIAESLLKPINPTVIIILGIYTIVWGLWIVNPFWTVFTQAPLYTAMESLASEYYWGTQAIIAGLVISYGAMKPNYNNILQGALIAFFHWFIIGIMYFVGDWHNTGGITSLTFAIYSALIWLNIRINRKYYQAKHFE